MVHNWILALVILVTPALFAQESPPADPPTEEETASQVEGRESPRNTFKSFIAAFNQLTGDGRLLGDNADQSYKQSTDAGTLEFLTPAYSCLAGSATTDPQRFAEVYWVGRLFNLQGFIDPNDLPEVIEGDFFRWRIVGLPGRSMLFNRQADGSWLISIPPASAKNAVAELQRRGAEEYRAFSLRHYMPEVLLSRALFLEHWQWLGLVLLFALAWIVHRIVAFMSGRVLAGIVLKRTGLKRTASAAANAKTALGYFAAALLITSFSHFLRLPDSSERIVVILAKIIASIGAMLLAYRGADLFGARLQDAAQKTDSRLDDQLAPMGRRILKVLITVCAALFVLDNLKVDIVSFLAGLGVVGIGVGLAAKDTFANLFGSITVLTDKPFTIGDWIKVGGVEGTVEEIGFRSTRVRTFYNSLISVPNSRLVDSTVDNMGARSYRRYKTNLGVTYNTPPDRIEEFCKGIEELVRSSKEMRHDYFFVELNDFGASSMNILVYVFFNVPDWGAELRARQNFILEILRLAERLDVSFAFPSQSVYVESMPDSSPSP